MGIPIAIVAIAITSGGVPTIAVSCIALTITYLGIIAKAVSYMILLRSKRRNKCVMKKAYSQFRIQANK